MLKDLVREGELKRWAPWVGGGLLGLVLVSLQIGLESVCWDKATVKAAKIDEATGCFDFWLNRYQTLIGAVAAVGAAAAAWIIARRQIAAMEQQNRIAIGDIPPTYDFQPDVRCNSRLTMTKLNIINENRRAMRIVSMELLRPSDLMFVIYDQPGGSLRMISSHPYAQRYKVNLQIDGTRPGAPDVSSHTLDLWFVWHESSRRTPSENAPPASLPVRLQIEHEYVGGDRRRETAVLDAVIALRG